MARAFVTGSSTGLGLMAAQLLLELGHRVVVHGRNQARADVALAAAPRADAAVIGDLSKIRDMRLDALQRTAQRNYPFRMSKSHQGPNPARLSPSSPRLWVRSETIFRRLSFKIAESRRETVTAVFQRCTTQGPKPILQALGQGDETLDAQHHAHIRPAGEGQAEVIEPMLERHAAHCLA
jgi:hypothetical protein